MNIRLNTRGAYAVHFVDYSWGSTYDTYCGRRVPVSCCREVDGPITCRFCRKGVERRALTPSVDTESDADE